MSESSNMARQRINKPSVQIKHPNEGSSSSSASSHANEEESLGNKTYKFITGWKTILGVLCLAVAAYAGLLGYLETRVNTPFNNDRIVQKSGVDVPERYWGTYRPGIYMGMKSREPASLVFGLMWYDIFGKREIRHWCDQNDGLPSYGWLRHDGFTFGEQRIVDPPHLIETSFVKQPGGAFGGQWTVRVNVTASGNQSRPLALIWYAALDESLGTYHHNSKLYVDGATIHGLTQTTHNFKLKTVPYMGRVLHVSSSEAYAPGLDLLKEKVMELMQLEKHYVLGSIPVLTYDGVIARSERDVNFTPLQFIVEPPFVLDIVYSTEDVPAQSIKEEGYTAVLESKRRAFDVEFLNKFHLDTKGYSDEDIAIARAGMSNMIGGIGYFYGAGRVSSQYTKEPVPYWRAPLYTAVPSRSFFPRGFLWDEGFHSLLISRWSPVIALDIASHWLDLINIEGWIPREQILGKEAVARVPKEFVVQSNAAANPPMLLIALARLVKTHQQLFEPHGPHRGTLDKMFTRLQAWYQWFHNTQRGAQATTYRWRGREDDGTQLNPKSLSSGLDDYPRASHPSDIERHVDLRCWMFAASGAMVTIADMLQRDTKKFQLTHTQLGDEDILNELHWSEQTQTYADYGLHTDAVKLVRQPPKHPNEESRVVRSVTTPPQPKLVTSAFGYVSLFPMLLKVLQPTSEKLGKILETLDRPDLLWSPYGLRSLSKSAPLYMKRNTEHDPPYWRGQVWINMNYLALSALKHYAGEGGPYAVRAGQLHDKLRDNVVNTILNEYKRTGYYWEQYSGETGRGSGCRPFTGWTALVTLIMAEDY